MTDSIAPSLLRVLACPHDYSGLHVEEDALVCSSGHRFSFEDGIPLLTDRPRRERIPGNMPACEQENAGTSIDPFVDDWVVNTNGNLYWGVRGRLPRYPIPRWPGPSAGAGRSLVDIGCGWGRWVIAAGRAGFRPTGVDVHMDALQAATRVSRQLGVEANFVCCEAPRLPFLSNTIDMVFSYSVLQHIEKTIVAQVFKEIARILKPRGSCLLQLPNEYGLYNVLKQARRGFRAARANTFEMRYWSASEIRRTMNGAGLKVVAIQSDGFFSQNPQLSDLDLLTPLGRATVLTSHAGCEAARRIPALTTVADSWFIEAQRVSD